MSETLARRIAEELMSGSSEIARRTTALHLDSIAGLRERLGPKGVSKCTEDAVRHVSYLGSAIAQESPELFKDYVAWAKILIVRLGLAEEDLAQNLACLRRIVVDYLDGEAAALTSAYLDAGLQLLPEIGDSPATYLSDEGANGALALEYISLLLASNRRAASQLILDAVDSGVPIRDIYLDVFQRSQYEIGRLWQMNEVSVAQEHFCTAATQLIMSQLYPRIFAFERTNRRVVAASVGGDLHEIGIRMVADFFEMDGWDSMYLGANTPLAAIAGTVMEFAPDVLAISATMTYHLPNVEEVVSAVRSQAHPVPRILVGGYPFRVDDQLWRKIGADGCGKDALDAVALANRLITKGVDPLPPISRLT